MQGKGLAFKQWCLVSPLLVNLQSATDPTLPYPTLTCSTALLSSLSLASTAGGTHFPFQEVLLLQARGLLRQQLLQERPCRRCC